MNWFSGILPSTSSQSSTNSPSRAPTALQQQRRKQIDSLRAFHHTVTEVRRDVEYQISFNSGSHLLALNVILPPQFPNEKPVVTVSPPCSHPWINDQMVVVGCSPLNAFYMHSNLGKVLQDVVKEFCEHPPQTVAQTPLSVPQSSSQSPSSSSSSSGYTPLVPYAGYTPLQVPSSGSSITSNPLSRVPFSPTHRDELTSARQQNSTFSQRTQHARSRKSSFSELATLSLDELKLLSEDPELCLKFISKLDEVEKLKTEREELMRENEDIAKKNISAQPQIESHKDALLNKYGELTTFKQEFDILFEKQQELLENYSFTAIQNNLQISASKVDAVSEEVAEQFLEGVMTVDKFVPKFMEKRRLYHSRLAKEEKILQLPSSF